MSRVLVSLLLLAALLSTAVAMEMVCTRLKRKCIDHAPCINRTCFCPEKKHGDALLACANEDEDICLVRADPHVLSYGLAKGNIPLPCRYRVAAFKVPVEGQLSSTCHFEVFGFNLLSQSGKYFTAGLEISLTVTSPTVLLKLLKIVINHAGAVNSDGASIPWGAGSHSSFGAVTIICDFEVDQNFVFFKVPECGTTIRFRPYKESDEPGPQVCMPGIAVISPKRATFDTEYSRYPYSVCGTPGDTDQLYVNRGLELGINNSHGAILHDVLQQGFKFGHDLLVKDQTRLLLPNAVECSRAIQAFHRCSPEQRPDAVRFCMQIMSNRRMTRCLRLDVLETFIFCLDAVCKDLTSCRQLTFMFRLAMRKDPVKCAPPRKLRKNVNCTFV